MHTTRLFGSLRLGRETQKTKTQSLMYDSKDSKDLVCTRLWGKVLSASSCIAIYRGLICIKKPLRKTKKCTLLVSFKYILHSGQVMIRQQAKFPFVLLPSNNDSWMCSCILSSWENGIPLNKLFTLGEDFSLHQNKSTR